MKRVQRTFAYRGWTIQCDRSGIWDVRPPGVFYDRCYKSKAAAELAVDKALVASAAAAARGDYGTDDFGVPYRSAQHAAYDRALRQDVGIYMPLKNEKVVLRGYQQCSRI